VLVLRGPVWRTYGRATRRTDKRAPPQEHLTTAATMYREMGMAYWLEKAETEMAEFG
jgi:hypothetical protein